ncbi:MAG TPA: hypothetical protein VEY11_20025 [Pyrinomonadaceae bacterium]|nr:hypothetical protein [Pyrinomonadaceae bacterium]
MPNVRLPVHSSARLSIVACALVVALLSAALVCVEPPASSACPVTITNPLRVRYMESALVAVVRVGDSVAVERRGVVSVVDTALRITSLLKGEEKEKVVNLRHFKPELADWSLPIKYEKDEVLLLFLKRAENGDEYMTIDGERAALKLSEEDLKVYVRRIEELAAIMRSAEPDDAAIAEWLVRCAEEPATRWEGASELAYNVSLPEDPPDAEDNAEEETEEAEASTDDPVAGDDPQQESEAEAESEGGGSSSPEATAGAGENVNAGLIVGVDIAPRDTTVSAPEVNYAALLTPAQKERLTTALLNAEEFELGEQLLLVLVNSWKDERLVPFTLKHLARMADKPPYEAEIMMRIVAHALGDQTLIKFVVNYRKTVTYHDLYGDDPANAPAYEEDPEATPEQRAADRKEFEEMKVAAAEALFQRSGKLRHFLALADQPQKP